MEQMNPEAVKKVEDITKTIRQVGGGIAALATATATPSGLVQSDGMAAVGAAVGGALSPAVDASSGGAGAVIAGTLTALIVAGGLKGTYDFISKQYG
jgi:hypothetical protein